MKRRDFIAASAGLVAGTAVPTLSKGQARPCPLPSLGVVDGSQSNTSCPGPGTAPSWFVNMADKTWAAPITNTLDSVKPNPLPPGNHAAICTAWTGGCVDQDRGEFILAANGGHTDYGGNEVYACALRQESPAWVRLTSPSDTSGGSDAQSGQGNYGDGKPRSVHGWHRCCWGNGRVWYAGLDGMYRIGQWTTACWSLTRSNLAWSYHGQGLTTLGGNMNGEAGSAAYDRVGNRVWATVGAGSNSLGQSVYSIDGTTGVISQHPIALRQGRPRWTAIAHDLRIWILGCPVEGILEVVDLANLGAGTTVKIPTGSPSGLDLGAGSVYHAPSRAIFCWNGYGTKIRKLSIPANPITGTYTWSEVSPGPSNSVTPSAGQGNGTYSRFNLIDDMGNGQGALCLVNSTTGPVYVYKLPVSGV